MLKTKPRNLPKTDEMKEIFEDIRKTGFIIRAINHKTRQQIMRLIHENKELTVSEIYYKLKLEQSQTSAYLAILRKAGVVNARRDGQSVYYGINYKRLSVIDKGSKIINHSK